MTAVDVTNPRKPVVILQTDLPHDRMRSNDLDVVGDIPVIAYQTSAPGLTPAGFEILDVAGPTKPRKIGYPMLKPHDVRHGVALEVLEQHHDLEQARALLGHARLDTTQIYTTIRPPQPKRAVAFYEEQAQHRRGLEKHSDVSRARTRDHPQNQFGGPNGIRTRVCCPPRALLV